MAKCPNTRLTIPECSCSRCVEEQLRRVAPTLLENKQVARAVPDSASTTQQRRGRLA
jgi:hypothetical protein